LVVVAEERVEERAGLGEARVERRLGRAEERAFLRESREGRRRCSRGRRGAAEAGELEVEGVLEKKEVFPAAPDLRAYIGRLVKRVYKADEGTERTSKSEAPAEDWDSPLSAARAHTRRP
jgi:hypothetical protein